MADVSHRSTQYNTAGHYRNSNRIISTQLQGLVVTLAFPRVTFQFVSPVMRMLGPLFMVVAWLDRYPGIPLSLFSVHNHWSAGRAEQAIPVQSR